MISCVTIKVVDEQKIVSVLPKSALSWSLEDCRNILDLYTVSNLNGELFT